MSRGTRPVALVTGATAGSGRAIALKLAADGCHVVAAGHGSGGGAETVALCGGNAEFIGFDATVEADWARVTADIVARHGRLDAVVNTAGACLSKPLAETSLADFRAVWQASVDAVLLGTKYALRAMRDTGSGGAIVNISSVAGVAGLVDCAALAAAQAAVTHFSRIAAVEAGDLVPPCRVNSLNPGIGMGGTDDGLDDIAAAAAFLAGPRSRYVTGTAMILGGGTGA